MTHVLFLFFKKKKRRAHSLEAESLGCGARVSRPRARGVTTLFNHAQGDSLSTKIHGSRQLAGIEPELLTRRELTAAVN